MSPLLFFFGCVAVTLAAMGMYAVADFRRRRQLRRLAQELSMHFSPGDRFDHGAEVAARFPVAAPADPTITDVLYCRRNDQYCYVFRFDYTIGVTGPKLRRKAIVGFVEPCEGANGNRSELAIAPAGCQVIEQYRLVAARLHDGGPLASRPQDGKKITGAPS